jgi:hypothetical protein
VLLQSACKMLTFVCLFFCPAGDIDDEYLQELESSGRGASRTRAGRKTSLVAATV